jgi:hypothetical protein
MNPESNGSESGAQFAPISIVQDELTDTVKIEGVVYSCQLFRELAPGGMMVGQLFRISARGSDGVLVIERLDRRPD